MLVTYLTSHIYVKHLTGTLNTCQSISSKVSNNMRQSEEILKTLNSVVHDDTPPTVGI